MKLRNVGALKHKRNWRQQMNEQHSGEIEMAVIKLTSRDELNKACQKGGYLINIDPVRNVIHACGCQWTLKMDPEKREGGNYYCQDYAEAIEWLKKKHSKFKDCDRCLSGRRYMREKPL